MNEPIEGRDARAVFWSGNEFLLRRLHSLSGIVPVGAYMVVHLLTNASVLDGPATFQRRVYAIHSLGAVLPLVEWTFIFLPLLYHAIYGVLIVRGALPNSSTYSYTNNVRYTLQRATGHDRVRVHHVARVSHARLAACRVVGEGRRPAAVWRHVPCRTTRPARRPRRCKPR